MAREPQTADRKPLTAKRVSVTIDPSLEYAKAGEIVTKQLLDE